MEKVGSLWPLVAHLICYGRLLMVCELPHGSAGSAELDAETMRNILEHKDEVDTLKFKYLPQISKARAVLQDLKT